jgi:hypothetical protein
VKPKCPQGKIFSERTIHEMTLNGWARLRVYSWIVFFNISHSLFELGKKKTTGKPPRLTGGF